MSIYTLGGMTLKAFIESETAFEVCRRLVFPSGEVGHARGAGLHLLDVSGKIRLIAHFGRIENSFSQDVYSWEPHPLAAAASGNELQNTEVSEGRCVVLPLTKNKIPMGMMSVFVAADTKISAENAELVELISVAGGRFIDAAGLSSARMVRSEGFEDWKDLTERQMQVLGGMAQNMTNAEIARELLLSESTIRQETVRIYRALQVSGRIEAAKKAKALGLLGSSDLAESREPALNVSS
jgi:DNA-binding CsgD family transcriptional regulator